MNPQTMNPQAMNPQAMNRQALSQLSFPGPAEHRAAKACETCDRVVIGARYDKVSAGRAFFSMFLIYAPVVLYPFLLLAAAMTYAHLVVSGAKNVKPLGAFMPDWKSHRYHLKNQIVHDDSSPFAPWSRLRLFWIFNCTLYCPLSVATAAWLTYLVKLVENWWCPFAHGTKSTYADAPIDYSYWHVSADAAKLHPDDQDNPIVNQDARPELSP